MVSHDDPRQLVDPTTGRPILMAPLRQHRPMHTGVQARGLRCPFCPGNEDDTPHEVDAVRAADSLPDGPGWVVRAFPNKFPANAHHEVIAEGAEHRDQPADLDPPTWRASIALWQRRLRALEAVPGVACTFLFKNVGASAGASIDHNHSQILGLAAAPPRLSLELATAQALGHCPWCRTLGQAAAEGRLVYAGRRHSVIAPDPPKLPYETWLLPHACADDFLTTDVDSFAEALHALFAAIGYGLRRPAFNLWLHRLPHERFHWHLELQPRTGQIAGLELGGDMYINSLPAPAAAATLRAGLQRAGLAP